MQHVINIDQSEILERLERIEALLLAGRTDGPPLWTIAQTAEAWGKSTATVSKWVREGRIEAKHIKSRRFIAKEDVEKGPPARR